VRVGSGPLPGNEIAGFRLEELIGRGGMGAVYRATDVRLGRSVALKLLTPELAESERFRERFLRESQLASSLDHPHIVPIYAAGDADGHLYLAMRYVADDDLRRLIAREAPLDPHRALRLVEQVGDALDAAHERGLVHRDVKPGNILIAGSGGREHCYLTDFGLTKQTTSISGLTGTGELVGTIEYVSPEQIRGERVDGRSDVYSLACVLYECLSGERPFARDTEVATLWAHVHDPPPPLRDLGPDIGRVTAKALAKAPADRYGSCGELVAEAKIALGLGEQAIRSRRGRVSRPTLTRRMLGVAAAATALVAVVIGGLVLLGGSDGLSGVRPMSVGVIDPATRMIVADIPVGFESSLIAAGERFVWVLDPKARTLTTIDPRKREVVQPTRGIPADGIPIGLAVGEGSVWVAVNQADRLAVLEIGPELGELRNTIPLEQSRSGSLSVLRESVVLTIGDDALWALERGRGEVTRIDPETGATTRLAEGHGASSSIAVATDAIWLGGINGVVKLDPLTGGELGSTFVSDVVDSTATSIAIGPGATWFTANSRARLWLVPPAGNTVEDSFPVGDGPTSVTVDPAGIVWVASGGDGTVSRLDPRSGFQEAIELGSSSDGILTAFDLVWTSPGPPLRAG
jgi:serine/threonine-protein kinase